MMPEELFAQAQTRKVYSVSELTRDIRGILETTFSSVWVEGEISGYKLHASGHIYFSLKDESAILKCAFFKNVNHGLKFKPEDGLRVICSGKISVYGPRGDYQLYVEKMEPKGLGSLQLAFLQLKERLAKEGLFDEARKKPIPLLPARIGIVTSPSGAAIHDILKILQERFSNAEIIINPVKVQGEGAAGEIAEAIDGFNEFGRIDVMIVGRGGGSLEDLWAFNEEVVARAIYRSKIPVISAVGHEVDYTIADFVADLRAPTPSKAAELVIAKKDDLLARIEDAAAQMGSMLERMLTLSSQRLQSVITSYGFRRPEVFIEEDQQYVDNATKDIVVALTHFLELEDERFRTLMGKLEALSPLAILARGYSITLKLPSLSVVRNAAGLKPGDRIKTRLFKGTVVSKVESAGEVNDGNEVRGSAGEIREDKG